MMSENWFFNRQDGRGVQGPHPLAHLVDLLHHGELAPHHQVRCRTIGRWASVDDLKWFFNPKDGSGVHGPVTRVQLAEFLDGEEIPETTEVRNSSLGEWQPVLVTLGKAPPPVDESEPRPATAPVADDDGDDFELNVDTVMYDAPAPKPELPIEPDDDVGPEDDVWYCDLSGQVHGPLPWSRVHSLASMGRIKRSDKIRHATHRQWTAAGEFAGIFPKSEPPPAPPQAEPSEQPSAASSTVNAAPPETPAGGLSEQMQDWLRKELGESDPPAQKPVENPPLEESKVAGDGKGQDN